MTLFRCSGDADDVNAADVGGGSACSASAKSIRGAGSLAEGVLVLENGKNATLDLCLLTVRGADGRGYGFDGHIAVGEKLCGESQAFFDDVGL